MSDIWFKIGEATDFSNSEQTVAMPEVLIGSVKGPAGQAFASMMGQVEGHTRMFVVRDCNQLVRPATMMTTKATIRSAPYVELLGGVVQAAIGDAILDSVIAGVFPRDKVEEICMIVMVWLDPSCGEPGIKVDKKELYRSNHDSTKLAINRAMKGEPSIDELIANRKKVKHYSLEGVVDY